MADMLVYTAYLLHLCNLTILNMNSNLDDFDLDDFSLDVFELSNRTNG